MKKLILGTIILTMVLIMAMMINVNAAEISVENPEVKVDDTVTVTVSAKDPQYGFQFIMTYPTEYFKFVEAKAGSLSLMEPNLDTDGEVGIVAFSGSSTEKNVILTFKAVKETEGKTVPFSIKNFVAGSEELTKSSDEVTVAAKVQTPEGAQPTNPSESTQPTKPSKPTQTTEPTEPTQPTQTDETTVNEKDNTPKTGTIDIAMYVASSIVALGVITFAVKKIKK